MGKGGHEAAPGTEAARGAGGALGERARPPPISRRLALELVALRGKDVIGVRHLLDGRAYLGSASGVAGRVLVGEAEVATRGVAAVTGGELPEIAEASAEGFVVRVPPRIRARLHEVDGLGRLLFGPVKVVLREGDRAVLVLGAIQVRAQIVPIEIVSRTAALGRTLGLLSGRAGMARWVALVGALYVAALAICAALAPRDPARLEADAVRRVVTTAAAAAALSSETR